MRQASEPGKEENAPVRYAGFWVRLGAGLIDELVQLPIFGLTYAAATHSLEMYRVLLIPAALIYALYHILFMGWRGATPGKMAVHIKIVRLEGGPMGYWRALQRYSPYLFFQIISVSCMYIAIGRVSPDLYYTLDAYDQSRYLRDYQPHIARVFTLLEGVWFLCEIVSLLANEKKRAIHDFIAGTVVISTRPAQSWEETDITAAFPERMQAHLAWLESGGEAGKQGDFSFMNFNGRDLNGARFTKAILRSANFGNANIKGAHFGEAVLNDAMLVCAVMDEHTDFTGANLADAFLDAKNFSKGNVNLRSFARKDLPAKLRHLWDEQQKINPPT